MSFFEARVKVQAFAQGKMNRGENGGEVEKQDLCTACEAKTIPQGPSPQARVARELDLCWTCYKKPKVANRRRREKGLPERSGKRKRGQPGKISKKKLRSLRTVFEVIFAQLDALAGAMNEVSDVVETVSEKAEGIMATVGNVSGELEGRAKEVRERLSAAEDRLHASAVRLSERIPQEKKDWRLG